MGVDSIMNKLTDLPFQKVAHHVMTCDCQPTSVGILVSVSGTLVIDDSIETPVKFAQCFHLVPDSANAGSYWVHNDIFRLNYG